MAIAFARLMHEALKSPLCLQRKDPAETQPTTGSSSDMPRHRLARREPFELCEERPQRLTIGDVHDVRVRQTSAGLVIAYHCHAGPSLHIETLHESVDLLERARGTSIRRSFASSAMPSQDQVASGAPYAVVPQYS